MTLHFFEGDNDFWAITIDEAGTNLPSKYGPWQFRKSVSVRELKTNRGMDERALKEVQTRGFFLTQIAVTFEPSTTVPTRK